MDVVELYSGDTKTIQIQVMDAAENGSPVSLASLTSLTFGLWAPDGSGSAILTKGLGSGVTVTNAAQGIFTVTLSRDDTKTLCGVYPFECRVVFQSGEEGVVKQGALAIMARRTTVS